MKNIKSLFLAVIISFLTVYFANLFQLLTATIFSQVFDYSLNPFNPEFLITSEGDSSLKGICYSAPFLFIILMIEFSKFNLRKTEMGIKRFTLILVIIFLLGYMIVNLFFSAFALILANNNGDLIRLVNSLDYSIEGRIIFIFFILIIFFGYLNATGKFLSNYLQSQG